MALGRLHGFLIVALALPWLAILVGCGRQATPPVNVPQERLNKELLEAIKAKKIADAEALLDRGADPNVVARGTHYEDTPLTLACKAGDAKLVDALLMAGANPNLRQSGTIWTPRR